MSMTKIWVKVVTLLNSFHPVDEVKHIQFSTLLEISKRVFSSIKDACSLLSTVLQDNAIGPVSIRMSYQGHLLAVVYDPIQVIREPFLIKSIRE
jgi:hypothetical protein